MLLFNRRCHWSQTHRPFLYHCSHFYFLLHSLDFLGAELNGVDPHVVESILVSLILRGKIDGSIDQVNGELVLKKGNEKHTVEVEVSLLFVFCILLKGVEERHKNANPLIKHDTIPKPQKFRRGSKQFSI